MADMNKAEKLAAARRKLKEYQKKNKEPASKTDSENYDPKPTSYGVSMGPYEQNYVFDSGTRLSSPNEQVSLSPTPPPPVPELMGPGPSHGNSSQSLFSSVIDSRDFFDNLPSSAVEDQSEQLIVQEDKSKRVEPVSDVQEPSNDGVVSSEMPECDIRESDRRVPVSNSLISSSTESLRQLSLQLNGLIDESVEVSGAEHSELERRNQELAARLADREQMIEQLQLQLKEYQSLMSQLQVEKSQLQSQLASELMPVQEQLQLHIQTVGILVGEKTELQAALGKSQQTAKQKAGEVEDLQGRLKASRHRVTELEKELAAQVGTKEHLENGAVKQAKELDRLIAENKTLKRQIEEIEEDVSEARHRLDATTNECAALHQEVQDKQSQVDLLQLKVQQLTTTEQPDMDSLLEALHQEKMGLEWQVSELQQTVKSLGVDREQATQQYQDYLQQFNAQLKSLGEKLATASADNERLANREQSLVRHISELEKQLQQQVQRQEDPMEVEHIQELEQSITALQKQRDELALRLDAELQENSVLLSKLKESSQLMGEMQASIEALQADRPDTSLLLAAMESDKVAATQAVGQNQKLKTQLEELQNSFIKMSNDKLELTDRFQYEQHVNKELGEKLAAKEEELHEIRSQLEQKEELLSEFQENEISRLTRISEDQRQLLDSLRQELDQAKAQIETLTSQNREIHQTTVPPDSKDELLMSLSASVRQLELERDQLQQDLQQAKQRSDNEPHLVPHMDVNRHSYISMKEAMEKLEERFTRTMQEVAELTDEKQKLEHIVMQLQGETDTIGEYIALYQVQRSMLRQRALEKDEQLNRLKRDREEMKTKLNELTKLVQTLVASKDGAPNLQGLANGELEKEPDTPEAKEEVVPTHHAADKIMALLSEIGSSNLVDPQTKGFENFHPCPWCSGRLITV